MFRISAFGLLALLSLPGASPAQFIGGFGPGNGNVGVFGGGSQRFVTSQAPTLSVYNGQTSLMQVQSFQWSPVNVQVVQNGGQVAFVPQYQPIPNGFSFPVQAVQSPNGITRVSAAPTFSGGGPAPLFPITTFITPVFAGGAQGAAVPFTQYIQQPGLGGGALNTSVGVPAGGFANFGGFGAGALGGNRFGAPFFNFR